MKQPNIMVFGNDSERIKHAYRMVRSIIAEKRGVGALLCTEFTKETVLAHAISLRRRVTYKKALNVVKGKKLEPMERLIFDLPFYYSEPRSIVDVEKEVTKLVKKYQEHNVKCIVVSDLIMLVSEKGKDTNKTLVDLVNRYPSIEFYFFTRSDLKLRPRMILKRNLEQWFQGYLSLPNNKKSFGSEMNKDAKSLLKEIKSLS